jgi:hypothetical protein
MYTAQRQLHQATVRGVFREDHMRLVRLTPSQLAGTVRQPVSEIVRLGIRVGTDGKIGRPEIALLKDK